MLADPSGFCPSGFFCFANERQSLGHHSGLRRGRLRVKRINLSVNRPLSFNVQSVSIFILYYVKRLCQYRPNISFLT